MLMTAILPIQAQNFYDFPAVSSSGDIKVYVQDGHIVVEGTDSELWVFDVAGHQAITFEADRKPHINGSKCVGCHLCRLVCPTLRLGYNNFLNYF